MDKVIIDIDVIHGIISAYRRAEKNQTRIYGMILGTKKDNIYYVKEAIYGFIFYGEEEKTKNIELMKLNDESLKSIFNSLYQKFKMNNPNINASKINKENEMNFKSNDSLMILGGFSTDKEPFDDLFKFHLTLERATNEYFPNLNEILILVDPAHNDSKNIKFGVKAYKWDSKNVRIKKVKKADSFFVFFKEIKSDVAQNLNNVEIIGNNKHTNIWETLDNLKIDKNEKKNINELLLNIKEGSDNVITSENNVEFIKNKIQESITYLNILANILENKDGDNKINEDDLNKISYIISQLDPVLNDKEIVEAINKDINKKYNVDSLAQLLDVQLALSDKIRVLIQ